MIDPTLCELSFRAESRNLLLLSVLQNVDTQIQPTGIEPINKGDLLRARPFLQLCLASDCITNITNSIRNKLAFCIDSQRRIRLRFLRGVPKLVGRDRLSRQCKEPSACGSSQYRSRSCNRVTWFGINNERCLDFARHDNRNLRLSRASMLHR